MQDVQTRTALSFFVAGGTLPLDASSYIERQADTELLKHLREGHLCFVLNARQMGKSSLINRAAQRLREQGIAVAQLDLTAIGQSITAEQWYFGLLLQIGQQLDRQLRVNLEDTLDEFWFAHEAIGPMQRFFAAIPDVILPALPRPLNDPFSLPPVAGATLTGKEKDILANSDASPLQLVLAVDEIDAVRSISTFNTDEFFAGIREYYLRRAKDPTFSRITFCLLGTATPADLIKDNRITPFNIGKRIELFDFTSSEAATLAHHLPGSMDTLNRILYWTSGHPYLTQSVCRVLADKDIVTPATVDATIEKMFLSPEARETDSNLKLVANRLLMADCDQFALLSLYCRVWQGKRIADDKTNPLCDILKLSGVVKVERGILRVRNAIYAAVFNSTWVETHLPNAELRRQKQAFRRGLAFASLVAVAVLFLIMALWQISLEKGKVELEKKIVEESNRRNQNLLTELQQSYKLMEQKNAKIAQLNAQLTIEKMKLKGQMEPTGRQADFAQRETNRANSEKKRADDAQKEALNWKIQFENQQQYTLKWVDSYNQQKQLAKNFASDYQNLVVRYNELAKRLETTEKELAELKEAASPTP